VVGLDWSADNKGIYCGSLTSQGGTLSFIDLKGNSHLLWQRRASNAMYAIPSPDGRYLAIRAGALSSNVWMVEGF
jgi:hypothetical protein